jgi:probable HAF family extracellular repeat protein
MRTRGSLAAATCLALLVAGSGMVRGNMPAHAAGTVKYVVVDLGSLDQSTASYGTGINASGQVAGFSRPATPGVTEHAFRYTDGVGMVDLDQHDADTTFADIQSANISDAGQVAGTYGVPGPGTRAYYYADSVGRAQDLPGLGSNFGSANGANGNGAVAGQSEAPDGVSVAVRYDPGVGAQDLNGHEPHSSPPSPFMQTAYGINNAGQATGEMSNQHAFRYTNGSVEDLGLLAGFPYYSVGYAINNHGVVAGIAAANASVADAFIYDNGMVDLGALTTNNNNFSFTYVFNTAYAINDSGVVVGDSISGFSQPEPFIYDPQVGGTLKDLNDLIDPVQHWHLQTARGINNAGQITGWGVNPFNALHAYRLDPITGSQVATTTSLTSATNPSQAEQAVTFTAAVGTGAGNGTPAGTVTLMEGSTQLDTEYLVAGHATFSISTLSAGTHDISAVYNGDPNHDGSTSNTVSQQVGALASATTLNSDANPAVAGQQIDLSAQVAAASDSNNTLNGGTVEFKDGTTSLGTAPVQYGTASLSIPSLGVGSYSLTAIYSGNNLYGSSTSPALSQAVNQANTSTTLSSSTSTSVVGDNVTFTAQVSVQSPGSGTPAGTVTFLDGTSSLGTGTLDGSGTATLSTSSLSEGSHDITAQYGGDTDLAGSTSSVLAQNVSSNTPIVTLNSSPNPSSYGQDVTFSVTVQPQGGSGVPTGSVTFYDNGAQIGSATLYYGAASFTTSTLPVNASCAGGEASGHQITATYSGDDHYGSATSNTVAQTVNQATSSISLQSSANPSVAGQSVTFTVQVSAQPSQGGGFFSVAAARVAARDADSAITPSGTVTLLDGGTTLDTQPLDSNGTATFTINSLSVNSHGITAQYSGDGNYSQGASDTLTQEVVPATSNTTLTSADPNPSTFGQGVTFMAQVGAGSAAGLVPTGQVTFMDGSTTLGTATLDDSGDATLSIDNLSAGSHSIVAQYGGDSTFPGSSSDALSQVVNRSDTSTYLTSSASPSLSGQTVTFTIQVLPQGPVEVSAARVAAHSAAVTSDVAAPSGQVTLLDGSTAVGTATLDGTGTASFSTNKLSVGSHAITAQYGGDANYNGSSAGAVSQTVNRSGKEASATTLASSANPAAVGQSVTFTAQVSGGPAGTPTGSVSFSDGKNTLGTGTLNGGIATLTTSSLSAGRHLIRATYGGDSAFRGSAASLVQTVVKHGTSTTLTSSRNPSQVGQAVAFTARVSASDGGTPTGMVTFRSGGTVLGSAPLNGSGTATISTSVLSAGGHGITARYPGDGAFAGSNATPLRQVVNKYASSVTLTSSANPSARGQLVTFTAQVSGETSGAPTGSITFRNGGVLLATVPLTGGAATSTVSTLSRGAHTISASYSGDGTFATSRATLLQRIS